MTTSKPPKGHAKRVFLFLQGPHGPFFSALARVLRASGADIWRIGFNAGDQAFWFHRHGFIPYRGTPDEWPETFEQKIDELGVTDIVLYGDTRPVHSQAVKVAKARGVTVHVFEEGYLRPWWVTYERGGSNGNSLVMNMSVSGMQDALEYSDAESPPPPSHWGDMRQHVFYGAAYHWFVLFLNQRYRNFRPHRELPVSQEFRLYFKRLLRMPIHRLERFWATARARKGGFPYHLVLLQLGHDSSVQNHSGYSCMTEFLEEVIEGFAKGAPKHHRLVVKEHPLENHRVPLQRRVRQLARSFGVQDRVHYIPGGKLAKLLDDARTAVTINSTAGQQVLWRGIPLKVFGRSVYAKPEFVSEQPVEIFFSTPTPPDRTAYRAYRQFLLETSQIPGGFYSRRGRRQLLRRVSDMMLRRDDPYHVLLADYEAATPQLRLVK